MITSGQVMSTSGRGGMANGSEILLKVRGHYKSNGSVASTLYQERVLVIE